MTNTPVEEALERFQDALGPYTRGIETIKVIHSLDRVTAVAVYARSNSPLYDSAAMDGVAVISLQTKGASESSPLKLKHSEDFLPVETGDPVKPPFDAVIMEEEIQQEEDGSILIRSAAAAWQNVRPVGEDIVQREMILAGSHRIRPVDIGVMLSGGITHISVFKRPSVAIIPTGTEIVEPGEEIKEDGIIESNSRMLEALVTQYGGLPYRFAPIPDDYSMIKDYLADVTNRFDMVMVIAGTSVGREDFTVNILRELGEVIVHGVAMKPGKPAILAMVNDKPVIGVPGYPVSAYLVFENFTAPVLTSMSGILRADSVILKARITKRVVSSLKYQEYVRVKVGRIGGQLVASPLARGAGAAMSLVHADGFCVIDQDSEGVEAGSEVSVTLCRDLDDLDQTLVSIGSHDLILDVIADMMPRSFHRIFLSSIHAGSMRGLLALRKGEAHIAPIHIFDAETGAYNIPAIKSIFANRGMALIKGVGRTQGIMVKKGNPLAITSLKDLTGCRYMNRQSGSGTRVLLDYILKEAGIDPSGIAGYEREAATHMAVAAAVQSDSADAGMGVYSAAKAMDLDFIPIANEEYDFAVPVEFLEIEPLRAFISILKSQEFHKKLEELGGYTMERCGDVLNSL